MLTVALLAAAALADPGFAAPPTLREAAAANGLAWPPPAVSVRVDKSDHSLTVLSGETELLTWPVGLGDPLGDKLRQGDLRTPEGAFRVVTRNSKSAFHLFLGLSYPDADDAARGLRDGLVTAAQARAISDASRAGRQPNWNTGLGGAIGIHGGGGSSDWTLGCIALENAQIEELWEVAPMGTRVVVQP